MTDMENVHPTPQDESTTPVGGERRRRRSWLPYAAIAVAVALAAVGALVLTSGGEEPQPKLPVEVPEWAQPNLDEAMKVNLKEDDYQTVVVINAEDRKCWNAYIGSKALKGCGPQTYTVTGAPVSLGLNVDSSELDKSFIGLAVWDGAADELLDSGTGEKRGTVALTVALPD